MVLKTTIFAVEFSAVRFLYDPTMEHRRDPLYTSEGVFLGAVNDVGVRCGFSLGESISTGPQRFQIPNRPVVKKDD